ncbi:hypothetical protein [Inquilinus limosus]|uniref:Uncharacterized protein n=1 Tax=Inquilinus limosus TaxID=171674 RepID=A0A211ZIL4_9PROT|nr:hypothetical protein [Inquilinus limosus]OWJ64907.1 hypothetical protein BWR60_22370 [Inquilinus limosus]
MATSYKTSGSAGDSGSQAAGPGTSARLSSSVDLYGILQDAARDAVGAGSSDDIVNRMSSYIDGRLSSLLSNYDFFLSITTGNQGGAGGWGRNGQIFQGQQMWGGGAGILPGIGAQYGVVCVVVWL